MRINMLIDMLRKVEENNGNIEVVIDYETGMSGGTTTVDNLFVEYYTFQREKHPQKVVRLTS